MALYVTLAKYTQQGRQSINGVPERFQNARSLVESKGGKIIALYGLLGEWDLMAIMEAPDEKTAMGISMAIGKQGNISAQTMTAVSEEDFANLARNA
ncbi:MAG: GYD domain-containing protein [Candidatus Tectomicrobia bacterium]|nr:GYD domain-containing protein [Candidatus Tectomicrobia bacterium]